ncbi:MAG: helix-turn-helix transcriptional regulator [Alphaproteobacteria bacterium]|nr:helix-turn-helix transcriptional regulator [Alphaproteobacteria bacterium]
MTQRKTKGTPDSVDVHVGQRLRVRRSLLGMSQEKLAEAIGLTFQQIQKYERGVNRVSAGRLFQFSKILDVPIAYFYDQIGGEPAQVSYGMSDNDQEAFGGEDDVMQRKETIDLVRAYYSIEDPAKRKEMLRFIKSMISTSSDS